MGLQIVWVALLQAAGLREAWASGHRLAPDLLHVPAIQVLQGPRREWPFGTSSSYGQLAGARVGKPNSKAPESRQSRCIH